MPNLVGVVCGLASLGASLAGSMVLAGVAGDSFDAVVMTIEGFSEIGTSVSALATAAVRSSIDFLAAFPSSIFNFFADSVESSVDGRF